jgi:hypothetical protein
MYQIDFRYLAEMMCDTYRRQDPVRIDWLTLLTVPIEQSHTKLSDDWLDYKFLASHTAQTLSLEHLINSRIPVTSPATIEDGEFLDFTYIGQPNEAYIDQLYTFEDSEVSTEQMIYVYSESEYSNAPSFVILVNSSDLYLEPTIRS